MSVGGTNAITVESDLDALTRTAAELVVESAANPHGDRFTVALSGGSTPRRLFELLAASPFRDRIDWTRWCVFWADERLVAPDHADSNYQLAELLLLSRVPIPRTHVHRAPVELGEGDAVARAYEAQLRAAFEVSDGELPAFDLIVLGMGSDGHTASLFPGKTSLTETERWVVASSPGVLPPPVDRVTLTLPVLNAARLVVFLVAGSDKTPALNSVLSGSTSLPASQVLAAGAVRWIVDRTARGD
ncbi:MAG: 6-phosphogluconolactonase [Chloroflexi bacterium]|nr:6-phosphogluconolactonase [Chloroflexota bacterium]